MPTAPTPIDPLGTPPSTTDPTNFDARADALFVQLPTFVTQTNAVANNVKANADEAAASANTATTKASDANTTLLACISTAQAAAASAGAIAWVSGTTYADGDVRWSPIDSRVYRRRPGTAGAGTTDPSADPAKWSPVAPNGLQMVIVGTSTSTVAANTDTAFTNAAACAATVPAIGVGDAFVVRFDNGRRDNTVDLGARSMVGPNGAIRSGVITLDTEPLLALRWWGDYYRRA